MIVETLTRFLRRCSSVQVLATAALIALSPVSSLTAAPLESEATAFDDAFPGLAGLGNLNLAHLGAFTAGCPFVATSYKDKNSGFLDINALYAIADIPLELKDGVSFRIEGDFPKARYFSLQSYEGATVGNLVDSLPDSRILPTVGGMINPNLAAQPDNGGATYKYQVKIKYAAPPATTAEREANTLYVGPPAGKSSPTRTAKLIGYRIYQSDVGANAFGDKPLPAIFFSGPTGEFNLDQTPDKAKCDRNNGLAGAFRSATTVVPTRNIKFVPVTMSRGGVTFGNGDVFFLRASASQSYGSIVLIRTKRLVTPASVLPVPADIQTRYWSLCQYHISTTAVLSCLADRDLVTQADEQQVIVLSRAQPAAATKERGYNWLAYGAGQNELIGLRQLLPRPDFSGNYVNAVNDPNAPLTETLGEYAPDVTYCDPATFAAYADSGALALMAACRAAFQL